jgi:hypothetical protein
LSEKLRAQLALAYRLLNDDTLYANALRKYKERGGVMPDHTSDVSTEDLSRMVDRKVIRKVRNDESPVIGKQFFVFEEKDAPDADYEGQGRRRAIFWPELLNILKESVCEELGLIPDIGLMDVPDNAAQLQGESYAVCHDIKGAYFQLGLPQRMQPLMSFRDKSGQAWCYTRGPRGCGQWLLFATSTFSAPCTLP